MSTTTELVGVDTDAAVATPNVVTAKALDAGGQEMADVTVTATLKKGNVHNEGKWILIVTSDTDLEPVGSIEITFPGAGEQ